MSTRLISIVVEIQDDTTGMISADWVAEVRHALLGAGILAEVRLNR